MNIRVNLVFFKFSVHIAYAVKKANQILGLVRRSFTFLDIDLMKQLYTVMVRPHLEYGNVVWHPQFKRDLELLEVSGVEDDVGGGFSILCLLTPILACEEVPEPLP